MEWRRILNFDCDYVVLLGLLPLCNLRIGLVGILIASVEKTLVTLHRVQTRVAQPTVITELPERLRFLHCDMSSSHIHS